jgi:pyruvate,water dikinase
LNVRGEAAVIDARRRCLASIFTDRAIVSDRQRLRSLQGRAIGRGHEDDPRRSRPKRRGLHARHRSGFRDVVFITGSWGLGENIVQGKVDPDEFYVHKPTFRQGRRCVLSCSLGGKELRLVHARGRGEAATRNVPTRRGERRRFCLADIEVLELADYAIRIEEHYSRLAEHPMSMDVEWAKDGEDGRFYIVQARPETVASRRQAGALETYALKGRAPVLVAGRAVGEKISAGPVRLVKGAADLSSFRAGEVLVAQSTSPDWEPVMKTAAAIVTSRGGRTCHAAIVARELGVPAVVGAAGATERLATGAVITVMRRAEIETRIAGMTELLDIVGAMRSFAGMRIQEANRALPGIRRYAETMARVIGGALLCFPGERLPGLRRRTSAA